MNAIELQQLIKKGEGETLDFKEEITSERKIAKSIVAFANTHGGVLLVGVKDNGKIRGVDVEEEKHMLDAASQVFSYPPIHLIYEVVKNEGKEVLIARVKKSTNKPHFFIDENKKKWAYIRFKDNSVLASKIALEVMKYNQKDKDKSFTYRSEEKLLFKYLDDNNSLTLNKITKLLNIKRFHAIRILVNLIRIGVVKEDYVENKFLYRLQDPSEIPSYNNI